MRVLMPLSRKALAAGMALFSAILFSLPATAGAADDAAIRALISTTWDKPDAKVESDPIVISGDWAIASWTQGPRGGRALLKRSGADWTVILCSGDQLTRAENLIEAGVPETAAGALASLITSAEAHVDHRRRALFSLFGTAEPAATHPGSPHHPHHP